MKICYLIFIVSFVLLTFSGCNQSQEKSDKNAIELMTTQTLGLGYLEEFELDKAEKEFLKYIKMAPSDILGYANLGLTYLRMGKYPEAKKQLQKAIKIDPDDADVRLILATVYQMNDEREKAISALNDALKISPGNTKILYSLSELYSVESDSESADKRRESIIQLAENAPENLVPQLSLVEIYINDNEPDKAIQQLEIILKQFPEFPKEASSYYKTTLDLLRNDNTKDAFIQFAIFHNYMKVTAPYQAGIMDLKGPGGSLIGFPIITYDQVLSSKVMGNKLLIDVIKFNEVNEVAKLICPVPFVPEDFPEFSKTCHSVAADYDGDGDTDVYIGIFDSVSSSYKHFLYNNEMGRFKDVASEVNINHSGIESAATFIDYNNDGFLDLYILCEEGDVLYRNSGKGKFKNVTNEAEIGCSTGGNSALFFDLDQDGDLDLFETTDNLNLVFRNNGDGTFTEQAKKMGLSGADDKSYDAAFGDFDDDDDLDLVVVSDSSTVFYSNQRLSSFKNVMAEKGLQNIKNANSVDVADYNNDGFLDLFFTSSLKGNVGLFMNKGDGSFVRQDSKEWFKNIQNIKTFDARFIDFDNDGFRDIVVAGESASDDSVGLFLFHNEAGEKFTDVSNLFPGKTKEAKQIDLFDYNSDGDLDILVADQENGILLLRNEGGSLNHYMDLKLMGLRAGSAKNNHFGIGAKVEIRSGDLYQCMVVTNPDVHFGLGNRVRADIVRITWTNGVPQNIFMPNADQSLIEAQTLKGSCPFLYTWNGDKYVFVKDITWRSALGMPLGIMGGETQYGFADASDDYIKIPGKFLKPKNGKYSIQLTSELWETIYMDRLELAVVDHREETDVYVPEQFSPPPFPGFKLYQTDKKIAPVSAFNEKEKDVLQSVLKEDDVYLSGFNPEKYQGLTEMHSLTIDPGEAGKSDYLILFMKGWIFPTDASINFALSQTDKLNSSPPVIQVKNRKGEWQTVINNLGFPMGKDKTVIADLSGIFLSEDTRVRIVTNMEIYWDQIFFSEGNSEAPLVKTFLEPESADFHYRGFSKMYRKGGRYGPHWFDYYDVDENSQWRDLTGNYTRYGDVLPLLTGSDSRYVISNAGDEMTVEFDAGKLPELKDGWVRDFFIHSVGWVKDGDLNTALGNTVEPLPFHGMKSYPPSENEKYPDDPVYQKYRNEYNTRVVKADEYRNALKNITYNDSSK